MLTFEPQVIQILIQSINLYGMSIEKFKRMLKMLVSEHIFKEEDTFFLHFVPLKLCSKSEFQSVYKPRIERVLRTGFEEFHGAGVWAGEEKAQQEHIDWVVAETFRYIVKRRHFLKAYEVIEDLATNQYKSSQKSERLAQMQLQMQRDKQDGLQASEEYVNATKNAYKISEKELQIFKYQFLLNYMSQPTTSDKMRFLQKEYVMSNNYEDTVHNELVPVIEKGTRKVKMVEERKTAKTQTKIETR